MGSNGNIWQSPVRPRELRRMLRMKEIRMGPIPPMPPEYTEYRQKRLRFAVDCALLFLKGKDYESIARRVGIQRSITKQNLQLYVTKGAKFLVDRGVFIGLKEFD